jgi:4-hydroxy-2-oxoheptanedioate aldolase
MVPHGRSVADAEHAAKNSKFHPLGERGMETVGVDADFGVAPLADFLPWHNRETFVVLQIEEKEAVDSVEKIAEVPGIDVLFIGPGDLLQSYGKPGQLDAEELPQAMKRVAAACRKNNKWWGLPTGPDPEKIRKYLDLGARFIIPFGDYSTIARTWKAGMENVQNLLAKGNW